MLQTFEYVHFAFYTYIPTYITGVISAHVIHGLKWRFKVRAQRSVDRVT